MTWFTPDLQFLISPSFSIKTILQQVLPLPPHTVLTAFSCQDLLSLRSLISCPDGCYPSDGLSSQSLPYLRF